MGLMGALSKRGLRVKPFKVGPDYIDPMFHNAITKNPSGNLDSWMIGEDVVKHLYVKNSLSFDICIIEGVMGFYDGFGGISALGSTAHVSKIIKAPVVLVVNGEGMSLSIASIVNGFINFDKDAPIKGVIINKIKSQHHYDMLKEIIEKNCGIKVFGYLKPMEEISLKSRHLGLVTSGEIDNLNEKIETLVEQIEENIDVNALMELANEAEFFDEYNKSKDFINRTLCSGGVLTPSELRDRYPATRVHPPLKKWRSCTRGSRIKSGLDTKRPFKIGVARDKAFCFYYNDNLELLKSLGAELCEFSPLRGKKLPEGLSGLYIGGGYPEVFAKELENNIEMRNSVKSLIEKGIPAYAECGGLMYLTQAIRNLEGLDFDMVGVLPGISKMTTTLSRFGYVEIEALKDNVIANKGQIIRGHEFHYSAIEGEEVDLCTWKVSKKRNSGKESVWNCGYSKFNLIAGYPHIHFYSNLEFAKQFVKSCIEYSEGLEKG
jgi:cobyrinic acid a,c-diamide synthase